VATALPAATELEPSAVLVAVGLPDGDGATLARRLAALRWRPRVALTSVDADGQQNDPVCDGASLAFVHKKDLPNAPLRRSPVGELRSRRSRARLRRHPGEVGLPLPDLSGIPPRRVWRTGMAAAVTELNTPLIHHSNVRKTGAEMEQRLTARSVTGSRIELAITSHKRCGHMRHCGCCPQCQRAQLARWNAQLTEVTRAGTRH
jgi:hypothetical protein